jgi:hypothetical protein
VDDEVPGQALTVRDREPNTFLNREPKRHPWVAFLFSACCSDKMYNHRQTTGLTWVQTMNLIQVQDTDKGATFINAEDIQAVSVKHEHTPERMTGGGLEITTMETVPAKLIPASNATIVTLTVSGRDYVIRYDDAAAAHDFLNYTLNLRLPLEIFETTPR